MSSRSLLRPLLAVAIVFLVTLSGVFVASPVPTVRACNACSFLLTRGSSGSGNGQFEFPYGVAVDSSGNVYITDLNNSRVELFSDAINFVNISLVAGWNLISLPVVPLDPAIGKVLVGLIASGNLTVVWSYQSGKWPSFTPPKSGSLTTMQDGVGHWIYVTGPGTLYVFGNVFPPPPATPPSYSLLAGWNLVGFKPQPTVASETVGAYLTSITGDYNTNNVWTYDNSNGAWIRASSSTPIQPGQAMWLYMTTPATLRR